MVFTATHSELLSLGNRGEIQGRQNAQNRGKIGSTHVHHQAKPVPAPPIAPCNIKSDIFNLLFLPRITPGIRIGDQLQFHFRRTVSRIRRRLARRELPVSVTSTMASASTGGLTSVAPQLKSTCTGNIFTGKVFFCRFDQLRGDNLSGQIFGFLVGRIFRNG